MKNKKNNFRQGVFNPTNPTKYIGTQKPIYRSGWELKFFRWADMNENILKWGSENVIIPYVNPLDGRVHRYFVDNFIVFKDNKQLWLKTFNNTNFDEIYKFGIIRHPVTKFESAYNYLKSKDLKNSHNLKKLMLSSFFAGVPQLYFLT